MSKQDRQGVRTPADVERKFGRTTSELTEASKKQNEQIERQNRTMDSFIEKSTATITSLEKDVSRTKKEISTLKQHVTSFSMRLSALEQEDNAPNVDFDSGEQEDNDSTSESQRVSEMLILAETDSLNSETIYADKTFSEIDEAINSDSAVRVKLFCSSINVYVYLYLASHLPGVEVSFCGYFNGLPVTLQLQADDTSTS